MADLTQHNLFEDIAGFTAWSSEREPPLVFKLFESLYNEFDEVARGSWVSSKGKPAVTATSR
jgi:hypothetical protein